MTRLLSGGPNGRADCRGHRLRHRAIVDSASIALGVWLTGGDSKRHPSFCRSRDATRNYFRQGDLTAPPEPFYPGRMPRHTATLEEAAA